MIAESLQSKSTNQTALETRGKILDIGLPVTSSVSIQNSIAVGFGDGDRNGLGAYRSSMSLDGEALKAGVKYVSGDLTFNVGVASGDSKDNTIGSISGSDDSKDVTSASVSYAVAAGVTAILGYSTTDATNDGSSTADNDGSAWYIGANMAF